MNTKSDQIGTRIIAFTPEQIANIEPPPLSKELARLIKESGKPSLQQFVDHRRVESTRSLIQHYWKRD